MPAGHAIVAIAPLIIIWVKDTRKRWSCVRSSRIFRSFPNDPGLRSVDPGCSCVRLVPATARRYCCAASRGTAVFFRRRAHRSGLALIGAVVAEFVAGTGGQVRLRSILPRHPANIPGYSPRCSESRFRVCVRLVIPHLAGTLARDESAQRLTVAGDDAPHV